MFGLFKTREQRIARELNRLARQTVTKMDGLLARSGITPDDQKLISEHRAQRLKDIELYSKFESGKADEFDRLLSPIDTYEIYSNSMLEELHRIGNHPAEFGKYLRAIKAD